MSMEFIDTINAARISWCCTDYGITPMDLAAECGIAESSMQKVLDGEGRLTFNQLRKVADYFGRGVLFFLEHGPISDELVHTPQFRTLANQKPELSAKLKHLIERVERQREIYVALREDLDSTAFTRFDPPELPVNDPRRAAIETRQWLGLSEKNSFDTYRAAIESKGILVFRSNGYSGKWQIAKENPILGFSIYAADCPVIVIKKLEAETRQSFSLMHELGHLILQKASSIDDESDLNSHRGVESAANQFAGHLLVPDALLAKVDDTSRPGDVSRYDAWLERHRNSWGVSGEVILRRLLDAGRLTQERYEAYRAWRAQLIQVEDTGGTRLYRHREPRHVFGDTYVRTVLDALAAQRITITKASNYLDSLQVKDLHRLERYYAEL